MTANLVDALIVVLLIMMIWNTKQGFIGLDDRLNQIIQLLKKNDPA